MKIFVICSALVLGLFLGNAQAGEIKEIVLKDGSTISGEVVSFSNGIYTVKSDILGVIKLEESKVRIIQDKSTNNVNTSSNSNAAGDTQSLQQRMMNDKEVMSMIQSLQNDPDFKKLLEDPKIMQAVNAGDATTLMADPRFTKLLSNPTVQEIQKKVK